jgi:hypothetical protein
MILVHTILVTNVFEPTNYQMTRNKQNFKIKGLHNLENHEIQSIILCKIPFRLDFTRIHFLTQLELLIDR